MTDLTLIQTVKQIEKLKQKTGNDWFIKANKGSIKLMESSNNE